MRYLLDTNMVSNLVRDPHGRVANRITVVGEPNITQAALTKILPGEEDRFGKRTRISIPLPRAVRKVISRSTENPSSL